MSQVPHDELLTERKPIMDDHHHKHKIQFRRKSRKNMEYEDDQSCDDEEEDLKASLIA